MADFPQYRDLPVWSGDAWLCPLSFSALDTEGARRPLDLTGAQVTFVAEWEGGGLGKSWPEGGILVPEPASGALVLTATAEETRALPIGALARFSLSRIIAGAPETLLYGRLIVSKWVANVIG